MTYQVYRLAVFDAQGNSHAIGIRHEERILMKDLIFENDSDAREYVRRQNRMHSDLPIRLISLSIDERDEFVDRFCFGDEFWSERRYFLGKPPVAKIIDELRLDGIRVTLQS